MRDTPDTVIPRWDDLAEGERSGMFTVTEYRYQVIARLEREVSDGHEVEEDLPHEDRALVRLYRLGRLVVTGPEVTDAA